MKEKEVRISQLPNISVKRSDKKLVISGYAARFDKLSEDLGGFVEKIRPGAFKKALKKSDVRALFNHDPNFIIGRTGVNLRLKEDSNGLFMEIDYIDTPTYKSVAADIEAGMVTQQSFSFTTSDDSWETDKSGKIRTIEVIDTLFDVSPVTYPAYPDTDVAVRSLSKWQNKSSGPHAEVKDFLTALEFLKRFDPELMLKGLDNKVVGTGPKPDAEEEKDIDEFMARFEEFKRRNKI